MDNGPINSPETTLTNPAPVNQPTAPTQVKTNLLTPILSTILVSAVVFGTGGYFLGKSSPSNQQKTVNNPQNSPVPTVATVDSTVDWEVFTDDKLGFSFKHPSRYSLVNPVPGGDTPNEGSYTFNAGSKEDMFLFDVTPFVGTVDEFVKKYTSLESANGLMYTNLNVSTVLGDSVKQDNSSIAVYKYINQYDQNVNPGAQNINTYTIFLVQNNYGFIVRASNTFDNLSEITQIATSIKN